MRAKSNLGLDHGGIEYNLLGAPVPGHDFLAQRVEWGQTLDGSAHELIAIEAPDNEPDTRDDAEGFLRDLLAAGPVAAKEIRETAAALGYKWRTVERTKNHLGIVAVKSSGKDGPGTSQAGLPPHDFKTTRPLWRSLRRFGIGIGHVRF